MLNLSGLYFAYFDCWSQIIVTAKLNTHSYGRILLSLTLFTQTKGQLDNTVRIIVSTSYLTLELLLGFFPR